MNCYRNTKGDNISSPQETLERYQGQEENLFESNLQLIPGAAEEAEMSKQRHLPW